VSPAAARSHSRALLLLIAAASLFVAGCSTTPNPQPPAAKQEDPGIGTIARLDPALDELIPKDAKIEKLAGGFSFIEGPLWRPEGALWFSDVVGNVVRQWTPDGKIIEILRPGGYDGNSLPAGGFNGPNGMIADKDGAALLCQHGNRRIVRIAKDRSVTTLVDKFQGKKLSSPNDLVFASDGSLYFTDPPYGLPKQDEDPAKELKFNGVFRLAGGKLSIAVRDLTRPNGLAISPDQKTLYVANSDEKKKVWMAYDLAADGTGKNGRIFADVTAETAGGLPDGMKLDEKGNVYAAGPGGVWVFSPAGKHLGTIKLPEIPANCNWGDDAKSLYITAQTGLYRIKLAVAGQKALYQ
jgi:gluconolactonase